MNKQVIDDPSPCDYDKIIVAFSGGKDSTACFLHLLELGVPAAHMELWHHDVDGGEPFMDWPVTLGYCQRFAAAFGVQLALQWREGGFLREMLRQNTPTAPVTFAAPARAGDPDAEWKHVGGRGPPGTRRMFPQVTADLSQRWCSAYLKIDVAAAALRGNPDFAQGRFLLVTGERAQESAARARYARCEVHKASAPAKNRVVHQWRPILDWGEDRVWNIIARHRVLPHPSYRLGFGRVSCMKCIFGGNDQWRTIRDLDPEGFERIADYEVEFGKTIHRKLSVRQRADAGESLLPEGFDPALVALAMTSDPDAYNEQIICDEGTWRLPAGAFKDTGGPT